MTKKFYFPLLLLLTVCFSPLRELPAWGAEVSAAQAEISADIANLRSAVEVELADLQLGRDEIGRRQGQIDELELTVSEDLAAWGYTDEQREKYTQLLSDVDTLYSAYASISQLQPAAAAAEEDLAAFGNASVDINASDALRREIAKATRELDLQVFQIQSKINKLRLDLSETARLRQERQEAESGGSPLSLPQIHNLAFENAKLNVVLSWQQVRSLKQNYDRSVARIQKLQKRLEGIGSEVIFPEETLNTNLKALQDRIDVLGKEADDALKRLDSANFSMVQTRARLGSADVTAPLTPLSSRLLERQARLNYWESLISFIEDEIAFQKEAQQIWRNRYKLFHDQATGEEIWKYRDESQKRLQDLQRQMDGVRTMESETLRRIASLRPYMEEVPSEVQQNIAQAIDRLQRFIPDIINRYATLIPELSFLHQRLYAEAGDRLSALRIAEKVQSFSRETIMAFLDTELWKGEDYSVTVSKLIIAVAVFLSSFFLSSLGSRWIKRRMLKRFKASVTAANATQRIVFYILWIAFALIALNIVKIPLTAFAFMGGAMAVGLGFGMQNIFNNLISGFIVIFSRPFKVGDIIDVAGTTGTVMDIGSRATAIRTFDGLDVFLPNRFLLENSMANRTGSDTKKREIMTVPVGYEADTRRVEEILLDVVTKHSKVLKDPAPFVVLNKFADSGLEFDVYFWFDLRQAAGIKIASDMRHHLVSLFREEGINIPYPQRDVHIIPPKEEKPLSVTP